MSYLVWKTLHVIFVVLFLGNVTVGLFWAAQARRSGNRALLAATFQTLMLSERRITVPAVVGVAVSGFAAALTVGIPVLKTGWILWPLMLFALSGVLFGTRIAPLQQRVARLALETDPPASEAAVDVAYRALRWWTALTLCVLFSALAIMVLKPALPGL